MMKRILSLILGITLICSAFSISAFAENTDKAYTEPEAAAVDDGYETYAPALAQTGAEDDEAIVPRVWVETEDGNGTTLQKADDYVDAEITITDVDGTTLSDKCSFKVRGNTTAMTHVEKKSFAFKFSKKKEVLGMGKGKKWVLLSNSFDPSLLRNYMAIDFARELGLDYTVEQKFVELWVDGSYRGCYTMYEPIQEGKDRVDIDIDSNDGKKDFLIEYEQLADEDDKKYFKVDGWRFAIKEPDDTTDEQAEYVSGVMNDIVGTMKKGTREDVESVIDVDSFVKYYLLNEFMKTMDFDMTSVYYYYKDGKLYAGPAWDFDLSSGNTNPDLNSVRSKNTYYTDGILQNQRTLYRYIGKQDWFVDEVKRVYEEHFDYIENIYTDGGLLDSLAEQYKSVFDSNYKVWSITRRWINYQIIPEKTYQGNLDYLKNWCRERNEWLKDYYDLFSYEFLRGDADGDGELDIIDVTVIQRYLAMLKVKDDGKLAVRASITGSELSILDAALLQRYLIGFEIPYEIDVKTKVNLR